MRVENFRVVCPMDNTLHDALAHVVTDAEGTFVPMTECHKSQQCATCKDCLLAMRLKYQQGKLNQGIMEKPL